MKKKNKIKKKEDLFNTITEKLAKIKNYQNDETQPQKIIPVKII